jgi:hypothetical protein
MTAPSPSRSLIFPLAATALPVGSGQCAICGQRESFTREGAPVFLAWLLIAVSAVALAFHCTAVHHHLALNRAASSGRRAGRGFAQAAAARAFFSCASLAVTAVQAAGIRVLGAHLSGPSLLLYAVAHAVMAASSAGDLRLHRRLARVPGKPRAGA